MMKVAGLEPQPCGNRIASTHTPPSPPSSRLARPRTPGTAPVTRSRRRLPQIEPLRQDDCGNGGGGGGGGMRRAQSLSFLPGADGNSSRPRRRLPDPAQGKLIRHVETKLQEEARLRLTVVKELREEKQARWKAEDTLVEAERRSKNLSRQLQEKRKQLREVMAETEEERQLRLDLEAKLHAKDKDMTRLRHDLQRLRDEKGSQAAEIREFESTVKSALQSSWEEKRLRQVAEERLEALVALLREQADGSEDATSQLQDLVAMLATSGSDV